MIKTVLRWVLTIFMVGAGINHFRSPAPYLGMMPAELPHPVFLVQLTGVFEILGGLGLILPQTRRLTAWCLIALFVAIFPANLNMALNHLPLGGQAVPAWALWARLPLQVVLILWVSWFTRPEKK
ncbi:MAG: DoxX family membrane protein [Kofleriaceae bacterium]